MPRIDGGSEFPIEDDSQILEINSPQRARKRSLRSCR